MKNLTGKLNTLLVVFKLLFPLRVCRWVVYGCVLLLITAATVESFVRVEWLNALAVAGAVLFVFFGVVSVPMQAVTLASSRPFSLLGNSRQWLLAMFVALSIAFSFAIQWALANLLKFGFFSSLLVLWLMVSLILQLGVLLCSRWQGVNGFILFLNPLFDEIAARLNELNPIGILITLIASWAVFSVWWLNWKPVKFQTNNMMLPSGELHKRQMDSLAVSPLMKGKASSWIGARLLGFSDSWSVLARRVLGSLALIAFVALPVSVFMGTEKLLPLFQVGTAILLLALTGVVAQTTVTNLFRNLRTIWLCSPGCRGDLFAITCRIYVREVGAWTVVLIVAAVVLEIASGGWKGIESWGLILLSILLLQSLIFYTAWYIYQRKAASIFWCNWICVGIFLGWFYSVAAAGLLFPLPFDLQGISALWVWVPELAAIALMHNNVRQNFASINFLRAV